MDSIPLPKQLLPCLAIPFVELFPNLCLGWWTPPSLNLDQYKKLWYLRIALHSIAWLPLFEMLHPICLDGSTFLILLTATVAAIILRNILMKKELDRVTRTPLWKTNLPSDKRLALFVVITSVRPTDISRFDDFAARYVHLPTRILAGVIVAVAQILRHHLVGNEQVKMMSAFTVFVVGGICINGTRHGNTGMDCFSRFMFGAGFIAILHYVSEVSDIVLIKSIN